MKTNNQTNICIGNYLNNMARFTYNKSIIRTDHFMIMQDVGSDSIKIYRYNVYPDGKMIEYFTFTKDGMQTVTRIKDGDEWKPWLVVPGMGMDMLSDFMDALLDFGIQPKQHNLTSEEKTALEKHLSDMRKIVAKKIGVEL